MNDSHAAGIPSDHNYSHMQMYDVDDVPCNGGSCNYCKGGIVLNAEGIGEFVHEQSCTFANNNESEYDENEEEDDIDQVDE